MQAITSVKGKAGEPLWDAAVGAQIGRCWAPAWTAEHLDLDDGASLRVWELLCPHAAATARHRSLPPPSARPLAGLAGTRLAVRQSGARVQARAPVRVQVRCSAAAQTNTRRTVGAGFAVALTTATALLAFMQFSHFSLVPCRPPAAPTSGLTRSRWPCWPASWAGLRPPTLACPPWAAT